MEKRELKVSIGKSGGNASKNSKTYRFTIPNKWAISMGVTEENREIVASYDEEKKQIIIKKISNAE